jgi:hypothetical protein
MALFKHVDALESKESLGLDWLDCKETYTPMVMVPLLTNLGLRDRFALLKIHELKHDAGILKKFMKS